MNAIAVFAVIQAAMTAAPKAIELAGQMKDFISALFGAGLMTKAEQDALSLYVDAQAALAAAGIIPPCLRVDPDPEAAAAKVIQG